MEEVTTVVYETVSSVSELTTSTMEVDQSCVDSMFEEIVINSRQSAECLTSIVALASVMFICFIGKAIYNIFHHIFS